MQTILGTPYTPPTPEEMRAYVRQAHMERAQVLRNLLAALFGRRSEARTGHEPAHALLRRAA
jgi:hypothetical protein